MMIIKNPLALLLPFFLICNYSKAQGNWGKLFYVSFMENDCRGVYPDSLFVYIVSNSNCKAKIANRVLSTSTQVDIAANKINKIVLDAANFYITGSEHVSTNINRKRSLEISSSELITVFVLNHDKYSSDGTFVLPAHLIPNSPEIFIQSYTPNAKRSSNVFSVSEFSIINTQNSSVDVEITPTVLTKGGHKSGISFTVTLSKFQVYAVQSSDSIGNEVNPGSGRGDLTGTRVRVINGCGKINVFCGSQSAFISKKDGICGTSSKDHLYSQCIPSNLIGKEYLLTPFFGQTQGYVFKVFAIKNNTIININNQNVDTLNTGEFYLQEINSMNEIKIKTSNECYVTQYMKDASCNGFGNNYGDAGFCIISPISKFTRGTIVCPLQTSDYKYFYTNIVVSKNAKNKIFINGSLYVGSLKKFSADSNFYYTMIQLDENKPHEIKCDSGFASISYGLGSQIGYLYSGGANYANYTTEILVNKKLNCTNEIISFSAMNTDTAIKKYIWNFGNGITKIGKNVDATYTKPGKYLVEVNCLSNNVCGKLDSNKSYFEMEIIGPQSKLTDTIFSCINSSVVLTADTAKNYSYLWNVGSKNASINTLNSGMFWVKIMDTITKCVLYDSTYILKQKAKAPKIFVVDNLLYILEKNYLKLQWIKCDSAVVNQNDSFPQFIMPNAGRYALIFKDYIGCVDTVKCTTYFFNKLRNKITHGIYINPIPARGYLFIHNLLSETLKSYEIFAVSGLKILQVQANHLEKIDISKLKNGVYILRINADSGMVFPVKFIVEN